MPFLPQEAERFDGLSLLYWTIMGPQGINRAVQRLEFFDCKKGLGVKIIGGYREVTGEEFGLFIKRVVAGGLAAQDGRLKAGDLILQVNNNNLVGVTNDRAVEILRSASASNHMSLLVARDDESRKEFLELMEKYGSSSSAGSGRISPTQTSTGKTTDTASSSSSSRSTSPQLLSPKEAGLPAPPYNSSPPYTTSSFTVHAQTHAFSDSVIQLICVSKGTGLGLVIKGGANRAEGPMVFIQEMVVGGDCQRDGRLMAGDQLVSVNKESLIGVTYEEARSIITRTKLRPDPTVEIAFIRRRSSSSSSSGPQSPVSNQAPPSGAVPQARPPAPSTLPSTAPLPPQAPPASLIPRVTANLNPDCQTLPSVNISQVRVVPVRKEQTPIPSPPESATVTDAKAGSQESSHRKCSSSRLKLERLEQALDALGLKPTDVQSQMLKARLQTDPAGTVAHADFESLTRELFNLQWEESGTGPGSRFNSDDLSSLLESPRNPQPSLSDSDDLEEMERLRKDHIEALREIKRLQDQVAESLKLRQQMQQEFTKVQQDMKAGAEESRALRSRVHLAEAAQKQARGMEMDYEEVVHLLEAEIAELKAQRGGQPAQSKEQEETEELRKRVAVLECQLRKSEGSKKGFEVSTNKLLKFVEAAHEFLQENQGPVKSYSSGDVKAGSSQGARHVKKSPWTAATLAVEAKELTRTVRAILEVDCLPYGWEEAYTADGVKYFINHVTQTTSWTHPVTSAVGGADREPGGHVVDTPIETET
ncbi:syntaxin-binding protein 4 [Osmerus mordax]|uniref:syntaxin-binding protein 4 n=1 Tax=Osmerus mordax TaxID=8014 RepID=UPI00350F5BA1